MDKLERNSTYKDNTFFPAKEDIDYRIFEDISARIDLATQFDQKSDLVANWSIPPGTIQDFYLFDLVVINQHIGYTVQDQHANLDDYANTLIIYQLKEEIYNWFKVENVEEHRRVVEAVAHRLIGKLKLLQPETVENIVNIGTTTARTVKVIKQDNIGERHPNSLADRVTERDRLRFLLRGYGYCAVQSSQQRPIYANTNEPMNEFSSADVPLEQAELELSATSERLFNDLYTNLDTVLNSLKDLDIGGRIFDISKTKYAIMTGLVRNQYDYLSVRYSNINRSVIRNQAGQIVFDLISDLISVNIFEEYIFLHLLNSTTMFYASIASAKEMEITLINISPKLAEAASTALTYNSLVKNNFFSTKMLKELQIKFTRAMIVPQIAHIDLQGSASTFIPSAVPCIIMMKLMPAALFTRESASMITRIVARLLTRFNLINPLARIQNYQLPDTSTDTEYDFLSPLMNQPAGTWPAHVQAFLVSLNPNPGQRVTLETLFGNGATPMAPTTYNDVPLGPFNPPSIFANLPDFEQIPTIIFATLSALMTMVNNVRETAYVFDKTSVIRFCSIMIGESRRIQSVFTSVTVQAKVAGMFFAFANERHNWNIRSKQRQPFVVESIFSMILAGEDKIIPFIPPIIESNKLLTMLRIAAEIYPYVDNLFPSGHQIGLRFGYKWSTKAEYIIQLIKNLTGFEDEFFVSIISKPGIFTPNRPKWMRIPLAAGWRKLLDNLVQMRAAARSLSQQRRLIQTTNNSCYIVYTAFPFTFLGFGTGPTMVGAAIMNNLRIIARYETYMDVVTHMGIDYVPPDQNLARMHRRMTMWEYNLRSLFNGGPTTYADIMRGNIPIPAILFRVNHTIKVRNEVIESNPIDLFEKCSTKSDAEIDKIRDTMYKDLVVNFDVSLEYYSSKDYMPNADADFTKEITKKLGFVPLVENIQQQKTLTVQQYLDNSARAGINWRKVPYNITTTIPVYFNSSEFVAAPAVN